MGAEQSANRLGNPTTYAAAVPWAVLLLTLCPGFIHGKMAFSGPRLARKLTFAPGRPALAAPSWKMEMASATRFPYGTPRQAAGPFLPG